MNDQPEYEIDKSNEINYEFEKNVVKIIVGKNQGVTISIKILI
jgi:hypothetical protein